MKKIIGLSSLAMLFLSKTGKLLTTKKEVEELCFSFSRRLRINIILTIFCLASLTPVFAQDAKAYYDQGLGTAYAQQYEEAIKLFDKAIAVYPKHHMAWYDKGRSKIMLGRFKEAMGDLDQAIKLDARFALEYEKSTTGDMEAAFKLYDTSIILDSHNYEFWLYRGEANMTLARYHEALSDFNQVLKLYPGLKQGWLIRGIIKHRLADYPGAIEDYAQAIGLDSNYSKAYFSRGAAYEMLGKKDSACADYHKSTELGSTEATEVIDLYFKLN